MRGGGRIWRILALAALVLFVAAGLTFQLVVRPPSEPDAGDAGGERRPDVLLIVLDMVRADRLGVCGYGRPTSPTLRDLSERPGAALTCRAYAPGTWTLPSHASFFTGVDVPAHGADCTTHPEKARTISLWGDRVRPLGEELTTLAERMRRRGYRSVMVSGNPVVSKRASTGLARGFQVVRDCESFGDLYGEKLVAALRDALDASERSPDSDRPLFLFVNVCDAHHPWAEIPPGLSWVPPRLALDNRPRDPQNPYPRFFRDQLSPREKELFLELISDSYDYAVFRSDRTLKMVIDELRSRGALEDDFRLVVTSDHGEFLGEHELLSHGTFTYEEDTRVPLLLWERRGGVARPAIDLDEPISALAAHDLTLTGRRADPPRPVRAAGYPDGLLSELFGDRLRATTAALWSGDQKLFWKNGTYSLFDLDDDPRERNPRPLAENHPLRDEFERFVTRVRSAGQRPSAPSPEMVEALKRLGYVN